MSIAQLVEQIVEYRNAGDPGHPAGAHGCLDTLQEELTRQVSAALAESFVTAAELAATLKKEREADDHMIGLAQSLSDRLMLLSHATMLGIGGHPPNAQAAHAADG